MIRSLLNWLSACFSDYNNAQHRHPIAEIVTAVNVVAYDTYHKMYYMRQYLQDGHTTHEYKTGFVYNDKWNSYIEPNTTDRRLYANMQSLNC